MEYVPAILLTLIAATVGTLQLRKARRFDGLKRKLALGVSVSNYVTTATFVLLFLFQGFDWPGFALVIAASILSSIALWTASLIWTGPAEKEDRQVFVATSALMFCLFVTSLILAFYSTTDGL